MRGQSILVAVAVALALVAPTACIFGDGPKPGPPSEAQVVFVPPSGGNACTDLTYVGSVAIQQNMGFAIPTPYIPFETNCNGSGQQQPLSVLGFDTNGSGPMGFMVNNGNAGNINGGSGPLPPRVTTLPSTMPAWLFSMSGTLTIGPSNTTLSNIGGNGCWTPIGIASTSTTTYVALEQCGTGGGNNNCFNDPASPVFPSGCGGSLTSGTNDALFVVPNLNAGNVTPTMVTIPSNGGFAYNEMFDVFAETTNAIYFILRTTSPGSPSIVVQQHDGDAAATTLATFPRASDGIAQDAVPVGIDADGTRVVWVVARAAQTTSQPIQPGCFIFSSMLPSGPLSLIFHTNAFSCLGGKMDANNIYFAIVGNESATDCNNCTPPIHGNGIGRVAFSSPTFESIATGISGVGSGPRRVLVDYGGGDVYAVDPNAIAKISKMSFANRHDFQVESDALTPQ